MAFNVEDLGTDARSADGWVVLFAIHKPIKLTGVLAVPATSRKVVSLRKLKQAIDSHPVLKEELKGFKIKLPKLRKPNVVEVSCGIRLGSEETLVPLLLEFLRQCNVITNPIVSDIRNFTV